jgi:ABC-2 type transport system ATP-binding protein
MPSDDRSGYFGQTPSGRAARRRNDEREASRVIEAIDLTVRRRGRTMLESISFDVRPGQVTGVLGGNSAGKSTLLRRMVQLEHGGGRTLFNGRRFRALRHPLREVGLVLEPACGHPDRSVRGYLRLALAADPGAAVPRAVLRPDGGLAAAEDGVIGGGVVNGAGPDKDRSRKSRRLSGRCADRIDAVLDVVGLSDERSAKLGELTDSMAARLAIAAALLGDPAALLLDCPDRDLEPEGVAWLGALLRTFAAQGRAALVTGSDTESMAAIADRILLLDHGHLVGTRTSQEVLRGPGRSAVLVRSPHIVRFAGILTEAGATDLRTEGACLEVRGMDRARIGDLAFRNQVPVYELADRPPSSHPADVVLTACSGTPRAVVPIQPGAASRSAVTVTSTASGTSTATGTATAVASSGDEPSSDSASEDTHETVTQVTGPTAPPTTSRADAKADADTDTDASSAVVRIFAPASEPEPERALDADEPPLEQSSQTHELQLEREAGA